MPWPGGWTSTCRTSRSARGKDGQPVYLRDIWPTQLEVQATMLQAAIQSEMFRKSYADVFEGDERWNALDVPDGDALRLGARIRPTCACRRTSRGCRARLRRTVPDIAGASVLAVLGDSITTDHISPAGSIRKTSPAGQYLLEHGVEPLDFNSYGSRRGNHEVMVRGTFANVRLRNRLAPGTEGGMTTYLPTDEVMPIYEASMLYQAAGVPLVILAGKEYGSGSSRDWAAKGPQLLGVQGGASPKATSASTART